MTDNVDFRRRFGGPVEDPAVAVERAGVLVPALDMSIARPSPRFCSPTSKSANGSEPPPRLFVDEGCEGLECLGVPLGEFRAELLAARGADVRAKDRGGETPMHYAAFGDARKMAKWLAARGADICARENGGPAPLHAAARGDARDVAVLERRSSIGKRVMFGPRRSPAVPTRLQECREKQEVAPLGSASGVRRGISLARRAPGR